MYSWLDAAIDEGAEIVTANNRLARDLRAAYGRRMLAAGRQAWRTPRILPWSAWLRNLVEGAALSASLPLRLEAPASAVLWERLLREATAERLSAPGLVRQMQQTWQRLQDWCVPTDDLAASAASDDQRLFAVVAAAYERELSGNDWTDAAQLAALAGGLVRDGHIETPRLLVHAGFDRLTPAARRLFGILGECDTTIRTAPASDRRRSLQLVMATDADAEIRAAGRWARRQLAANPSARIAVVLASLESAAERTARILREGFVPGWQYDDRVRRLAVNVSYGRRLSEYPMIAAALLWLEWTQRGLDTCAVGTLLRSPFTGSGALSDRHRLDTRLRRLPDRSWSPENLASALSATPPDTAPAGWRDRLHEVAALARRKEDELSPAAWAERIDAFLGHLGWPGDKSLDSAEYQVLDRWRELLNELALLEPVRRQLRLPEAAARLSSLAREAVFQPEGDEGTLQLLGPLEAAGLEFDCVWFANLEATQWPPPAWPLPLVSRSLQRKTGMPDAGPADTVEHARRILARIAASASSVVLSRPQSDGDAGLIPSPLLDAWGGHPADEADDPGWFAARLCGSPLEEVRDDPVPPVRAGERVGGGAYTVQSQFMEPFTAFAIGRLGVRTMPAVEIGLSASLRGTAVHHALRTLLADRPSRTSIRDWTAGEREHRIRDAVDAALLSPSRHADAVLQHLLALERMRLEKLLQTFIDAELSRPEFTVARVESELVLRRQGIELELRVDRIDRLDDGSLLVVDYKTGTTRNLLSAAGAPAEWQTVVYASALDEAVGGLVLINVDSRGIAYRGVGGDVPWNPLGAAEWSRRLAEWSRTVDDAIGRIAAGDARVNVALTTAQSRPLNVLSRAEALKRGD